MYRVSSASDASSSSPLSTVEAGKEAGEGDEEDFLILRCVGEVEGMSRMMMMMVDRKMVSIKEGMHETSLLSLRTWYLHAQPLHCAYTDCSDRQIVMSRPLEHSRLSLGEKEV